MAHSGSLIWADAHEELADSGKLGDKVMITRDEFLHRLVVTDVAQITEYGHEALAPEWECVGVDLGMWVWREDYSFAGYLVGEERRDDG